MYFPSNGDSIPAVHRARYPASRPADPPTASSDHNLSVAVVHDAEGVDVRLRERVDRKHRHEAYVVAFADCPPAHAFTVEVEPLIMSELECLEPSSSLEGFPTIIVARTLATWHASEGSVAVQNANPSCDGVALPIDLCLGQ